VDEVSKCRWHTAGLNGPLRCEMRAINAHTPESRGAIGGASALHYSVAS